eukprot:12173641-Heterocapsa_arctica.AAC.1
MAAGLSGWPSSAARDFPLTRPRESAAHRRLRATRQMARHVRMAVRLATSLASHHSGPTSADRGQSGAVEQA